LIFVITTGIIAFNNNTKYAKSLEKENSELKAIIQSSVENIYLLTDGDITKTGKYNLEKYRKELYLKMVLDGEE